MINNCKKCEYKNICDFNGYEKVFRGKCYVDDLAEKLNLKPETVIKRVSDFKNRFNGCLHFPKIDTGNHRAESDGHRIFYRSIMRDITRDEWIALPPREKEEMINNILFFYGDEPTKQEIKLQLAVINLYLDCVDEKSNRCISCGCLIEQSEQNNRKYCDKCKTHKPKVKTYIKCPDCGDEFIRSGNRQTRCPECQKELTRKLTYDRVNRYRCKCNDLEQKVY